jgi:hypothetical protein
MWLKKRESLAEIALILNQSSGKEKFPAWPASGNGSSAASFDERAGVCQRDKIHKVDFPDEQSVLAR